MGGGSGSGSGGSGGSGGGSGSGSQGSLAQTTKLDADKLDVWESLKKTLPSMLSNNGVVVINPSMGTVTMRDEPVVIEEISRYLTDLNASMAKQVAIDVTIYLVSLKENSQYGINWATAFQEAGKNLNISAASMAIPQVAAGAAALSFLIPENGSNSTMRHYSGSELLINALESTGTITNRYSVPVRTQNLQPVQIGNRVQEAYLAQSGSTQTANVGSTSNNVPGLLTTGLELAILPHIQDTNDLVIQYGVTLSAKAGLRTITNNDGSSIEAPEVGISDFVGRVTMRSGQTLVMSGLEQLTMKLDETGNLAAGGGWTKNGQHIVMVLAITPRLETAAVDSVTRLARLTKQMWPFSFIKSPRLEAA
jgi:type IVB pilus formation R64 PilN family outer membrane protein